MSDAAMDSVRGSAWAGQEEFRVEWHPGGEHLKVCDLSNDGETIHGRLKYKSYDWYWKPLLSPPASSDAVEVQRWKLRLRGGTEVSVYLYDDKAMTEQMAGFYNLRG